MPLNVFEELQEMQSWLDAGDWFALCGHYHDLCSGHDPHAAALIRAANLTGYSNRVEAAFKTAVESAKGTASNAIYFEYNLDNSWDSTLFLCPNYRGLEDEDDDWACEFTQHISAGAQQQFADIYEQTDQFCNNDQATAATLYMIARTVGLVQQLGNGIETPSIALCAGFHDQDPVHRLKHAT